MFNHHTSHADDVTIGRQSEYLMTTSASPLSKFQIYTYLVLLILRNKVAHVASCLCELHLVHTLACIPVQERLENEHINESQKEKECLKNLPDLFAENLN